jgi:Lon protease-like protein
MAEASWVPLFPLGVVLLPGNPLPLHIFEDRYKTMIGECLERKEAFGLVLYDGARMASSGCTAQIVEIRKRYPDGRLDILTRGGRRFRVLETDQSKPYLRGRLRFFDDQEEELGEAEERLARRGLELLAELDRLSGREAEAPGEPPEDLRALSFRLAGCEGFALEEKQRFLEMTSARSRLAKAVPALEKLIARLQVTLQIQRIIGGNGHPPSLRGR